MARVNIHGAEQPIEKIFSNDFLFNVPLYQRPYAWTTEQAGELISDLLAFMGDGDEPVEDINPYFMGSIVLIKEDSPQAQIVDGQQRLTTLTILLSVLRHLMTDEAQYNGLTEFLYEKGNPIRGTSNRYRLILRERDAEFFRHHIQDEGGIGKLEALNPAQLPESQENIRSNALLFIETLKELSETTRGRLARFIVTRCFLVAVSTPDLNSAYRIFSVLNDRGLDLSPTDILKAETIGQISEKQQEAYTTKWEDIEEELGREPFRELFAHIRMIYGRTKLQKTVLEEFRESVKPTKDPKGFIDTVLTPYAEAFGMVRDQAYESTELAEDINAVFKWLNQIDNFDWMPPAIYYLARHQNQPADLLRFFTDLERLAAGLFVMRASINERISRYGRLIKSIEDDDDLYTAVSPLQLTADECKDVIDTLNGDLYKIQKIRLYVLLRLDQALSDGEASYDFPVLSIEHVLPQTPEPDSTWLEWFQFRDPEQYVHRLGNLVLLSRKTNSRARNYEFDDKKSKYFVTSKGISPFSLTTQVLQEKIWTPEVILRRQKELMGVLKKVWRLGDN